MIPIVYCAAGNRRFAEIAVAAGMHYGAQLPGTVYLSPFFVDQDWKKPNREAYVAAVNDRALYANAIWAGAAFFVFVGFTVVAGIIQSGRGRDE